MKKIHGFPGIGNAGKEGIKGKDGINNYFLDSFTINNNLSFLTNNTFIFNNKLEKFYKNEEGIKKIYSYKYNSELFKNKNNTIYSLHNLFLSNNEENFIENNNYNLSISTNNEKLLSFISKNEKSILLNDNNNLLFNNNTLFIIKTPLYTKEVNKVLLKNFEDKIINSDYIQIEKNTSKNEIKVRLSLEYLTELLLKNIEISLIINGTFDGISYNEERIIKPYEYDKLLLNEIIFKINNSIISNYDFSLYYKIKAIQEIPIEKNEDLSSNFFTLYKKLHNEKSEE